MTTEICDRTLREASDWFARLHGDDAGADDHMALAAWLSAGPEHREAYEFVTETCRLAAHAYPMPGDDAVLPARKVWSVRIAAGIAALAVSGAALFLYDRPATYAYQTAIGEIRNVTLEDGTGLVVNGATAFKVHFDGHTRDLTLETGELFVTVGKDPARPFRIHAGDRTIEDVGTAFDVNMHARAVDVAVSEGTIMISGQGFAKPTAIDKTPDTAVLSKGQALTYAFEHALDAPRSVTTQQVGTWRVGVLTYDRVSLEWLVADLNRQFDGSIMVADPQLAAMTVTLTLRLRDRDATIGTLEKLLPIRAIPGGANAIELVQAKS
ncbi:MAG: anti-FecI sigma factor, FecR [Rhodospirillales bacterium]|nr:anti-FecI sigma factor, FecR [Rhodospirillales bacterium]